MLLTHSLRNGKLSIFQYDDNCVSQTFEVETPSGVLDIKVNHDILGVVLSQGIYTLFHSRDCLITHSFTYSLTHLLTHLLSHLLTHQSFLYSLIHFTRHFKDV